MYTPSDGNSVNFEFLDSGYTFPAGDSIAFIFSEVTVDYVIVTEPSEHSIMVVGDNLVEHLPDIENENSEIKLTFTDAQWLPVAETFPLSNFENILLKFIHSYPIPEAGTTLTLRFGATGDAEIISNPSDVLLFGTEHQVSVITDILSGHSELRVHSNDSLVETLVEIQSSLSEIQMSSSSAIIETLVEIQSSLSEIQVSGTGGTLEVIVNIQSEHSEIKFVGTKQEISEIILILSEQSEIQIQNIGHDFEVLTELEAEPSEITIKIPEHEVEHLPEVMSEAAHFIIFSNEENISGGQANDLPNNVGTGSLGMRWKETAENVHIDFDTPWEQGTDLRLRKEKPWKKAIPINDGVQSPFMATMLYLDDFDTIPWGEFEFKSDAKNSAAYISKMDFIDDFEKHLYEGFVPRDEHQKCAYEVMQLLKGDFKDSHKRKRWDKSEYYDFSKRNSFNNDLPEQIHDRHHGTYWGPYWYSLWCQEMYFPWKGNEDVHLVLKSDFPNLTYPEFLTPSNPRCPFGYWYSGGRDGPIIPPPPYTGPIMPLVKGVYYMNNTVFVKRLPSMEDIEVFSLTIATDIDSFVWDFSLVITDRTYLDLIKPQSGEFIDIQITVNGFAWTCRVEEWGETVSFGQRSWTVNGRSQSIELTSPFSNTYSFTNSTNIQAYTLVNDLLSLTGWTAEWTDSAYMKPYLDWNIPANIFSFSEKTTMEGIREITETVGAFINTAPDTTTEKKLIIKPRYMEQPWNWNNAAIDPDFLLIEDMSWEIARKFNRLTEKDHVILAGETEGVLAKAVKDGAGAGTKYGGLITHPLFTTIGAVSERGRIELAESGNWIDHTIRFFSLKEAPEGIGLVTIGSLVEMAERGTTWRGVVKGCQINVSKMNKSTAVEVSQQLEISEYING